MWLWIQRDFVNPGIWAVFLCVHHCSFRHTCGIYLHYPQTTSLTTTSNDEFGQAEDKIALPFVEKVHRVLHLHFSVLEGASLLMCCLSHVPDTLQVPWQASAKMSPSAIRSSEIPPKYQVASHCVIVPKHCSDPQCLPSLMRHMLATIDEPSILQKHPGKRTSPPGTSDVLAFPQFTRAQWGVHSPCVSGWVVVHWQDLFLTTAWSSMAFESKSSGAPDSVELLRL